MKIVRVEWIDAGFTYEAEAFGEWQSAWPTTTVGYSLGEADEHLHVAAELVGHGFRAITHIPLCLIRSRVELADVEPVPLTVVEETS